MSEKFLTANPFRQSPLVKVGDTDITKIYRQMGYAIHRFNQCESSFAYLYNRLANPALEGDILLRSFGVIVSNQTRRYVIEEAAASYFRKHKAANAPIAKRITKLLEIYKDASSRRNDIAHGGVYGANKVVIRKSHGATVMPTEWFLTPIPTASNKRDPLSFGPRDGMRYRYNAGEIEKLANNFELLEASVTQARDQLREFAEKLPQEDSAQQKER